MPQAKIPDDRVKARPTFHFRLPNCEIDQEDWSLAEAWNAWCVVEKLSARPRELDALAKRFLDSDRLLIGVNRQDWVEQVGAWLDDHGLV